MFFSINVNLSLKIIPFILLIIIIVIKTFFENNKTKDKEEEKDWIKPFNIAIFNKSFYIISVIFYFIFLKLNKNKNDTENKNNDLKNSSNNKIDINNNIIQPIVKVAYKDQKNKALLLSILCAILSIPIDTIKIKYKFKIFYSPTVFGFITILFFNYFLFKKKLTKHRQLSILLFCTLNFPLFIYFCCISKKIEEEIFNVFFFSFNCIKFCIYQYIMENLFISFYFIFFIEGLCFFIPFVMINIIIFFIDIKKFSEYYNKQLLINNSINFTVHFLYFFHINFYDSMNCMILEIFSRGLYSVCLSTTKELIFKIMNGIITFLSLILIFIYEEVIILNFCEFDKYVQKNLIKRNEEENDFNDKNISMINN
jgi:hypothetical protein